MARLEPKDVQEIARLARLVLSEQEAQSMSAELSSILGHMEQLAQVHTDGVEPLYHAYPMPLRLREDQVGQSLDSEEVLAQAPDHDQTSFRVPSIITKSGSTG